MFSYFHRENKTVLLRSAQPLTGPNKRRCKQDAELLNSVLGQPICFLRFFHPSFIGRSFDVFLLGIGSRGYIIDTRQPNVAKLAQAKGGGMETDVHYSQWKKMHQAIERHTNLHENLAKLLEGRNITN